MKTNFKHIMRWGPLLALIIMIAIAYLNGWHSALSLETLQAQKEEFQSYAINHPLLSAALFAGGYIGAVALSLPIATLLTLLGGFLFGKWLGTLIVVTSATIGASIIFLIAKTSLGTSLREKAGKLYNKISKNMEENATGYLLFLRLVPLFPFVLVNIVPALFNVPLRIFVLTTFFGIIPGTFVYVNLGETLGEIEALSDLVSGKTLFSFGLLGLFALIPTLYKQFKARKTAALLIPALLMLSTPAYANDYDRFLEIYDNLLQSHITPSTREDIRYNSLDYAKWKKDKDHVKAREILLASDHNQFKTKNEKLAFWINTYNFLTIDLIARENEQESIKNLGGWFSSPWEEYEWTITGKSYTLDNIEHKILRPIGEPRIHFAINCAAISCPDLRDEAYRPEILNRQLNEQVVKTLNNHGKGYRFDNTNQTVYISKIFDWFEDDFNDGNLQSWLKLYKPGEISPEAKIKFLPYDWSLNKVPEKERLGEKS